MPRKIETITVGDLKRQLRGVPDDWELTFGGCLEFYRTKVRGEKHLDIEFSQVVWRDDQTGEYTIEDPQ